MGSRKQNVSQGLRHDADAVQGDTVKATSDIFPRTHLRRRTGCFLGQSSGNTVREHLPCSLCLAKSDHLRPVGDENALVEYFGGDVGTMRDVIRDSESIEKGE